MTFEDLECWKHARQVAREVYTLTRRDSMAKDFGLCGQIQRAGVSTMSNIAEGFERHHVQEKLQFYNVARGSNAEVRSLTYVIEDNYPTLASQAVRLREQSMETGRLVGGLIRSTAARRGKFTAFLSSFCSILSPF